MRLTDHNLSTGCGLAAILLWSTTFAFARSLSEQLGPLTAGAAVYLLGGSLSVVRLFSTSRRSRFTGQHRLYLLGCGALFVFYTVAVYLAVGLCRDREQLLEIALVNYLWPALTMVLSIPILRKRARGWLIPGTFLALAGVFLVMTQGVQVSWTSLREHVENSPAAYVLALLAAITWALYSNLARRWSEPGSSGASEIFLLATGLVLLAVRFSVTEPGNWSGRAVGEVIALAAMTAVAYVFWDAAMRKGNLLLVVAFSYFTPLLSTLVSCLYLKVSPAPKLWIGCLLLVCGSVITWRSVSDRGPQEAPGTREKQAQSAG